MQAKPSIPSKGTPSISNQIGESIEKSSGRKLIFVIG